MIKVSLFSVREKERERERERERRRGRERREGCWLCASRETMKDKRKENERKVNE